MSHIVSIKTQVTDAAAVRAACQRLRLPQPVEGTTKLLSDEATGLAVKLPDWRYAVVYDRQAARTLLNPDALRAI